MCPPRPKPDPDTIDVDIPDHVAQYFGYSISDIQSNPNNPLYTGYSLYDKWIADVGARLNTYESQIGDVIGPIDIPCDHPAAKVEWERRVLQAVNDVLGLANTAIETESFDGLRGVTLPSPWRDHIRVLVSSFSVENCASPPVFAVDSIYDTIVLIDGEYDGDEYLAVDGVDETTSVYVRSKGYIDVNNLDPRIYEELRPHYKKTSALATYVKKRISGSSAVQPMTIRNGDGSELVVRSVFVPSGFFNFIESVIRTDAYTYALFPKTEVLGVLAQRSSDFAAALSGGLEAGQGSVDVRNEESERAFRTAPRTVGFSDATTPGAVEFGWVISGPDRLESTQKSGLALVSVPAWTNELALHVETGWVDGRGALAATKKYDLTVPIPPDYEAFDAFVGGSRIRHEPRISNDLMGIPAAVNACEDVSIIIPGFRLWRSTVVTLGSQVANRIIVLPNMRGIVAKFDRLLANAAPVAPSWAKLQVWTSEGVDTAAREIKINPPREGVTCSPEAEVASGDDGAGDAAAGAGTSDRSGGN